MPQLADYFGTTFRRWLIVALVLAAALIVAGIVRSRSSLPGGWVEATSVERLSQEEVVYLEDPGIFVVSVGGSLHAFSDTGTHQDGERILYCRSGGFFIGVHGERFLRDGRYYGGPARSDLHTVSVRREGDVVLVDPSEVDHTKERSRTHLVEGTELAPGPFGPACDFGPEEGQPGFVLEP